MSDVDRARRARAEAGRRRLAYRDGSDADRDKLVQEEFAPTGAALDGVFARFEEILEQLDGHFLEIQRALQRRVDLDVGPVTPLDKRFAALDPAAHLMDDLFATKVAMVALLNFPLTTLQQRLDEGDQLVAAPVGRGAAGRALRAARAGGGAGAAQRAGGGRQPVHRRIQHPHAPPRRRRDGRAALPARHAAHQPLEPARRAQGRLRGQGRPAKAADDRQGDGADRRPDDPEDRHRQRDGRLGSVHQRGDAVAAGGDRGGHAAPGRPRRHARRRARARHALSRAPRRLPRRRARPIPTRRRRRR